MSRFVGEQLTEPLLSQLGIDRAIANADRAIVICTVDEHGWPHPAMLSTLEVVARDARNVRIAMDAGSRSARNMTANGKLSLILVDEQGAYYVKGDVLLVAPSLRTAPSHAKFNLRVDSVLEDVAQDYEHARIACGIRVERDPIDAELAGARLRELVGEESA